MAQATATHRRATYEIAAGWGHVMLMLEDAGGELNEELSAQLSALEAESADKFENLANVIEHYSSRAAALEATSRRFAERAATAIRTAQALKDRVRVLMEASATRHVETASGWEFRICANGGKLPLRVAEGVEARDLEPEFQRVTVGVDTDAVRKALEGGEHLTWAWLEQRGSHLRCR